MERETKEILTPGGLKIVLKTWLTGRERREIRYSMLKDMNLKSGVDNSADVSYNITADQIVASEDSLIKSIVVSVEGKSDNILNDILDLRAPEYEFILAEVRKINDEDASVGKA